MSGILTATRRMRVSAAPGVFDSTAFTANDSNPGNSSAACTFNTDGSATLVGSDFTSPASPRWWTTSSPPATWLSYSSTGGGTITGGLVAGTRYQLNVARTIGINNITATNVTRTFTITYFDAASGGSTVGTKTFTASADAS